MACSNQESSLVLRLYIRGGQSIIDIELADDLIPPSLCRKLGEMETRVEILSFFGNRMIFSLVKMRENVFSIHKNCYRDIGNNK